MCAGTCATLTALGERLRGATPLRVQAKWITALGALWSVGVVCACGCSLNARSTANRSWRSESALGKVAMLSAAAVLSFLVFQRPHYRLFVASFRRSSWTDALLFLPSATGFFMPAICGGVEYPWKFWTSLVQIVVGIAAVSALLAQQNCFAVRRCIRQCFAPALLVALAAIQVVALSMMLCIVLLRSESPEAAVVDYSCAESRASMLVLLSVAVAVTVAVADVVSGVAMILACHVSVTIVLGAAVAWSLPRLTGELGAGLGASALALWTPALGAVGNGAWLATAQALVRRLLSPSLAFAASVFLRNPVNTSVPVPPSRTTPALRIAASGRWSVESMIYSR